MNVLDFCTLTGADDRVNPKDLLQLSDSYPFAEWGVLFHYANQGKGRYASFEWIDALCNLMPNFPRAHFALHICGRDAVHGFLQGTGKVSAVAVHFGRIQLNLVAANVDPASLIAALQIRPDKTIITQHNTLNESLWRLLRAPNHAVLLDESGGLGISPGTWPSPLPGKRCGYAGGLGPDNLATELQRIQFAAGRNHFWIDMEGKLRSESDYFDLSSAQTCLSIVHEVCRHDS